MAVRVNKNLIELKVFFLEIVHPDLYSGKVWGFSIFSFCIPPGEILGRLLLKMYDTSKRCSVKQKDVQFCEKMLDTTKRCSIKDEEAEMISQNTK